MYGGSSYHHRGSVQQGKAECDCLLMNGGSWDTTENNFVLSNVAGGFQQGRLLSNPGGLLMGQ